MADIGAGIDIELDQQVEFAGSRIDFRRNLGVGDLVGNVVGFAELAFDLDEEGDHARLLPPQGGQARSAAAERKSSKNQPLWQGGLRRNYHRIRSFGQGFFKCRNQASRSTSASTRWSIPTAPAGTDCPSWRGSSPPAAPPSCSCATSTARRAPWSKRR